eukprot:2457229-Prymnesium_polylepis.1
MTETRAAHQPQEHVGIDVQHIIDVLRLWRLLDPVHDGARLVIRRRAVPRGRTVRLLCLPRAELSDVRDTRVILVDQRGTDVESLVVLELLLVTSEQPQDTNGLVVKLRGVRRNQVRSHNAHKAHHRAVQQRTHTQPLRGWQSANITGLTAAYVVRAFGTEDGPYARRCRLENADAAEHEAPKRGDDAIQHWGLSVYLPRVLS